MPSIDIMALLANQVDNGLPIIFDLLKKSEMVDFLKVKNEIFLNNVNNIVYGKSGKLNINDTCQRFREFLEKNGFINIPESQTDLCNSVICPLKQILTDYDYLYPNYHH